MMYYCNACAKVRGFPLTDKTKDSHQCNFCDRQITKCNIGSYAVLVGLERNPDRFSTEKGSIQVHQLLSLPSEIPVTKIHKKEKKIHLTGDCVLTFPTTQKEDGSTTIYITNRISGEQISVQL